MKNETPKSALRMAELRFAIVTLDEYRKCTRGEIREVLSEMVYMDLAKSLKYGRQNRNSSNEE